MKTALAILISAAPWMGPLQIQNAYSVTEIQLETQQKQILVDLASFTLSHVSGEVIIEWSTSAEVNNYSFTVQVQHLGEEWQTVGTVAGAGNSSTLKYYKLLHPNTVFPASYRILDGGGNNIIVDSIDD